MHNADCAAGTHLVQQETAELGCAGPLQKLNEDLPGLACDALGCCLEGVVAHKVPLVVVVLELSAHGLELLHVQAGVDLLAEQLLHLVEVTAESNKSRVGCKQEM